jgi:hypothetical protein
MIRFATASRSRLHRAAVILSLFVLVHLNYAQSPTGHSSTSRMRLNDSSPTTMWDVTPLVFVDASIDSALDNRVGAEVQTAIRNPGVMSREDPEANGSEQPGSRGPAANSMASRTARSPVTAWSPHKTTGGQLGEPLAVSPASQDAETPTERSSLLPLLDPQWEPPISEQTFPVPRNLAPHGAEHERKNTRHKVESEQHLKQQCETLHLSPPECRLLRYRFRPPDLSSSGNRHELREQSSGCVRTQLQPCL